MEEMFLGIDIGSSSVKAVAVSTQRMLSYRADYPVGTDSKEHSPKMLLDTVRDAIWGILNQGVAKESIRGIGLDGHGPSVVFIDKNGKPLSNIVTWQDQRSKVETDFFEKELEGFSKGASCYEGKLLWFYKRYPELFKQGYTALYPKDYVIYALSGERIMDHSTASTIAFYDDKEKNFSKCEKYFPSSVMPRIVPAYKEGPRANTEYANSCGLNNIPICPGGIDSFCEIIGAGGLSSDVIIDGSGTSSCLSRIIKEEPKRSKHILKDYSLVQKTTNSSGLSYKWFGNIIGKDTIGSLSQEINTNVPSGLIYLPYLNGERCPIYDEKASGVFLGLNTSTTNTSMLQGLFEGVSFSILSCIEEINDGSVENIYAVGGANKNETWLQIKANITGMNYHLMKESDGAALGSALLPAMDIGGYNKKELLSLLKVEKTIKPEPKMKEKYAPYYEIYKNSYKNLKNNMHTLYELNSV